MRTRTVRSSLFASAAATAILILAASFGPTLLGHGGGGSKGFAKRAAGAYLVDIPERSEKYLLAFSEDGRVLSEDTNDFGNGVPAAFQSAFYGSWKRTGRSTLVYSVLTFGFDAGGVNRNVVRHTATVHFDKKFQNFRQDGSFAVFTAIQDPLDPNEVPVATGELSGTGRRIRAVVE